MTEVLLNNLERITHETISDRQRSTKDHQIERKQLDAGINDSNDDFLNVILGNSLEYDIFGVRKSMVLSSTDDIHPSHSHQHQDKSKHDDNKLRLSELDSKVSEFRFESIFRIKDEQAAKMKESKKQKIEMEKKKALDAAKSSGTLQDSSKEKELIKENGIKVGGSESTQISEQRNEDDLTSLRNRLLSKNSKDLKLSNSDTTDERNKVHEHKQESLLADMLGMVGQLKNNVTNFNDSLNEDKELLSTANEKLEKVGGNATAIMEGLKKYTTEYSNQYGFWFYVYVSVALVVVPLVMLLIIRLIPRL